MQLETVGISAACARFEIELTCYWDNCSPCSGEQAPAAVFCVHCHEDLCQVFCQSCSDKEHASGMPQQHKRVPIAERPIQQPKCQQHGERMKFFCTKCEVCVALRGCVLQLMFDAWYHRRY